MSNLTAKQIYDLSRQAGFDPASAVIATAVALAESKGNPSAIGDLNVPAKGASSVGLWQINYSPTMNPSPYRDPTANLDPLTNAKAAYAISSAGKNFAPWTTYTNGAYKSYLPAATAAAPVAAGDTGGTIGAPTPKSSGGLHIPGTGITIGNPLNALASGTEKVGITGLFLLAGLGLIVLGISRMAGVETKDIVKAAAK